MEKTYKVCQSCGMPFRNDPKGGGRNADGSINPKYCSYCYENGKFTQPDITVGQMQDLVKDRMRSMGMLYRLFASSFVKTIPKLERWNERLKDFKPIK